ncbi:uncharacterized protein LOC141701683 isoform X1 [Apium graveolens]|uniref:uncharacterized protein LOC141701683 isoform X1 n=1 Tax=Apium graveolens TaxID=4045 RepID=UPI003D7AB996
MEFTKKVTGGSSSSSSPFVDLFGPKDSSMPSSSAGHFSSVFGPSSTGLVRDYSPSGYSIPSKNQNSGSANEYCSTKYENQDHKISKSYGTSGSIHNKDRSASYETVESCNYSSSIHYGGQEVYPSDMQSKNTHSAFKKDGRDDNSNSASRGNWWQGMSMLWNFFYMIKCL